MAKKAYSVLLVDNSEDDRLFTRLAFSKHPKFALAGEVCDGEAAIAWLAGEGEFSNREKFPFPDLVVLDLKMPRKSGHEVLEWLQSQTFAGLRVVVLSGSFLPEDIDRSRELGAHAYYTKEVFGVHQQAMISDLERIAEHIIATFQAGTPAERPRRDGSKPSQTPRRGVPAGAVAE